MFVCWCCGKEFDSPNELKDHLLGDHVELEDYLVCPTCNSIVADLLSHFQSRHMGSPLPMGVPLQTSQPRKNFRKMIQKSEMRDRRKRFRQGFHDSPKAGRVHYRSSWELDVCKILDKAFSIKAYKVEPFSIPYIHEGTVHNYWPDFLLRFIDESSALIEVKPLSQCPNKDGKRDTPVQKKNDSKWNAANEYCDKRNMPFVVWTERAIQTFARLKAENLTKAIFTNSKDDEDEENLIEVKKPGS